MRLNQFSYQDKITISRYAINNDTIKKFEGIEFDLPHTEIKYENTIDRVTGAAMPRQQERVPAGSEFDFKLVYNIENLDEVQEDIDNIYL